MTVQDIKHHCNVYFSDNQLAALKNDSKNPRWDLNPPDREEYESQEAYLLELRAYANRILKEKA